MKPKLLLILSLLSLTLLAAAQRISPSVQRALINAISGERAAIARYDAFATKADAEGYPGAGDLFRAMAKAERIHLGRFTAVAYDRGLTLPPEADKEPSVGSTSSNLQSAISGELAERDKIYLDAYNAASSAGDTDVTMMFDQTRDAETEHANLCQAAVRNLDDMKQPKTYSVCPLCGYTTDVKLPMCPLCRHAMR